MQGRDEEEADLVRANEAIARLTGHKARGYRMLALEGLVADLAKAGAVFLTMEAAAREAAQRLTNA
jgi:hypothetical protein